VNSVSKSEAILAVAGNGKTESIIQRCEKTSRRRLIITFTSNGQSEIENRLRGALLEGRIGEAPEVVGWYKFLIEHFLKPYLPASEFDRPYRGFYRDYDPGDRAPGHLRYFHEDGRVGGQLLSYVASRIDTTTSHMPIGRLDKIYEEIVIDEAQDLVASDLVILERLLKSSISLYLVGDLRQIVFETNRKDRKYKKYRGLGKLDWLKAMSEEGLLALTEKTINYRCSPPIVELANQVFDPSLELKPAISGRRSLQAHHGVFYISEDDIESYQNFCNPLGLRLNKTVANQWEKKLELINFGESKGRQSDHTLIFPSKPIQKFLETRTPIQSPTSASKLYVAITRARHSVAFVMPKNSVPGPGIHWWSHPGELKASNLEDLVN